MIRIALAIAVIAAGCTDEASFASSASPLTVDVASDTVDEAPDLVTAGPCTRPGHPADFTQAANSGQFEIVTLRSLEILGEETIFQTVDSGTYETRALRISIKESIERVSRTPQEYDEVLVPIHGTTRFTAFDTGFVTRTVGCPDARYVDEQGSLASRVQAAERGGEMALAIELTAVHGPMVRNVVTQSDGTLRFDGGETLRVDELRAAAESPLFRAEDETPEWAR